MMACHPSKQTLDVSKLACCCWDLQVASVACSFSCNSSSSPSASLAACKQSFSWEGIVAEASARRWLSRLTCSFGRVWWLTCRVWWQLNQN